MKILYLHQTPYDQAKANSLQVYQMCRGFQQTGAEVTLGLPSGNRDATAAIAERLGYTPDFKILTYPFVSIGGTGKGIGAYRGARKLLLELEGYDACMVRSVFLACMCVRQGVTTLYEAHAETLNARSVLLDRLYRQLLVRTSKSRHLLRVICISRALADRWKRFGIPAAKLSVLHDGVAAEAFQTVLSPKAARKKLGLPENQKIVVYAGSLYRDRGIGQILQLAKAFSNATFVVVGGSEAEKANWTECARQNAVVNIFFTGRIPHLEVKNYLFAADVLLMLWTGQVPTIHICSPLKVFEYMAAERVIVGPGFPTIREVLTDGETALLSRSDDYEDLEKKMGMALNMPFRQYDAMARKAREKAFLEYTWEKRAACITHWITENKTRNGRYA